LQAITAGSGKMNMTGFFSIEAGLQQGHASAAAVVPQRECGLSPCNLFTPIHEGSRSRPELQANGNKPLGDRLKSGDKPNHVYYVQRQ